MARQRWFSEPSAVLIKELEFRNIPLPLNASGKLERPTAMKLLAEYEDNKGTPVRTATKQKYFRLTVHDQDNTGSAASYQYVGANGASYFIPKNEEVIVPEIVINILRDAVQRSIVAQQNPDGSTRFIEKPIQRIAYTVHGEVLAEERNRYTKDKIVEAVEDLEDDLTAYNTETTEE